MDAFVLWQAAFVASLDMSHCAVDGLCIPRLAGVQWASMPDLLCCSPVDTDNLQRVHLQPDDGRCCVVQPGGHTLRRAKVR